LLAYKEQTSKTQINPILTAISATRSKIRFILKQGKNYGPPVQFLKVEKDKKAGENSGSLLKK